MSHATISYDANGTELRIGDEVRLLSKPDGRQTSQAPVTVGNTYRVTDFMQSNVVTTTDVPGETACYWRGRVVKL